MQYRQSENMVLKMAVCCIFAAILTSTFVGLAVRAHYLNEIRKHAVAIQVLEIENKSLRRSVRDWREDTGQNWPGESQE